MIETAAALVLFLAPLAWSPGPGNLFFAANGARFGFRATIPANAGYHLATWIVTVAVGLGLSAVLQRYPLAFQALRWAGAGYVLWLAWGVARAGALSDGAEGAEARAAGIGDGAVLLLLNPKAYVIMGLMFAQFLGGEGETDAVQGMGAVLWIATVFTLNNLVAFCTYTFAGDRIAARFRSPAQARVLNLGLGAVLAGVAVWMALG